MNIVSFVGRITKYEANMETVYEFFTGDNIGYSFPVSYDLTISGGGGECEIYNTSLENVPADIWQHPIRVTVEILDDEEHYL